MQSKTICLAPGTTADGNGNYTGASAAITGDNWFITSLIVNNQAKNEVAVELKFTKSDNATFTIPFKLTAYQTATAAMAMDLRIAVPNGTTITITSSAAEVDAMFSLVSPN